MGESEGSDYNLMDEVYDYVDGDGRWVSVERMAKDLRVAFSEAWEHVAYWEQLKVMQIKGKGCHVKVKISRNAAGLSREGLEDLEAAATSPCL